MIIKRVDIMEMVKMLDRQDNILNLEIPPTSNSRWTFKAALLSEKISTAIKED